MSNRQDSPLRADRDGQVVEVAGEQAVLAYDPDGEIWFVRASSVPGLTATADTQEELLAELPHLIRQAKLP